MEENRKQETFKRKKTLEINAFFGPYLGLFYQPMEKYGSVSFTSKIPRNYSFVYRKIISVGQKCQLISMQEFDERIDRKENLYNKMV